MPNPTGKGGFRPGQSGNKHGRPRGLPNAATRLRREIEAHGKAILDKMIYSAERGNLRAGEFLLERVLPPSKSMPIQTPVELTGELPAQAQIIKDMLASGRITLDESDALLEAIGAVQAITNAAELIERVRKIEERLAALGGAPPGPPTPELSAPGDGDAQG